MVILSPKEGETVSSPVTVSVQPPQAGKPHMMNGSHVHVVIDSPLPAPGSRVPADANHIHLMHGQTSTTVTLAPGQHTVQIVEGSMGHEVPADAPHSDKVTFQVK
jgi:hypothetical protein